MIDRDVAALPAMRLAGVGTLGPPNRAARLLSTNVTSDGTAVTAWADVGPAGQVAIGLHRGCDDVVFRRLDAPLARLDCPIADVLPDDRLIVVNSRRSTAQVPNGCVVDSDGRVIASADVGDGINHLGVDRFGGIWCGYFDEGVFGGTIGSAGIVRFNDRLEPTWACPHDEGLPPIDDCYALNIDDECATACYYSDFPVVRIQSDRVQTWSYGRSAPGALIARGRRVAAFGGHRMQSDVLVVGHLADAEFIEESAWRVMRPDGSPLGTRMVIGRGPTLHIVTAPDRAWFQLSLDAIVSS